MSNFREVFKSVNAEKLSEVKKISDRETLMRACATSERDHRRLWLVMEHRVAHKYERSTGKKLPESIDWETLRQWLVDHWPEIVKFIVSLILMFI